MQAPDRLLALLTAEKIGHFDGQKFQPVPVEPKQEQADPKKADPPREQAGEEEADPENDEEPSQEPAVSMEAEPKVESTVPQADDAGVEEERSGRPARNHSLDGPGTR